jgi:hypothetical protein
VDLNSTSGWRAYASQDLEKSAFPGAVASYDTNCFTASNDGIQVSECPGSVVFRDMRQLLISQPSPSFSKNSE